jgi:hypothetical protein
MGNSRIEESATASAITGAALPAAYPPTTSTCAGNDHRLAEQDAEQDRLSRKQIDEEAANDRADPDGKRHRDQFAWRQEDEPSDDSREQCRRHATHQYQHFTVFVEATREKDRE